jgi:hypothetical protein
MSPNADVSADGVFDLSTPDRVNEFFSTENIHVYGNVDPFIGVSFDVVNNTGATQDYTFIFTIPIVAQTPATLTGGSTAIGVTDTSGNGDGVTLGTHSINGRPTYFSQIDLIDHESLDLAPLSAGAFLSNSDIADFGVPIPSFPGPAANSFIGIRYDFSLTAGDRAGVTGVFVVEAVPEPSSMVLFALASVGLGVIGRRRRVRLSK